MENKEKMRHESKQWLTLFLALLALTLTAGILSQKKELPPFNVFYSNSNGNVNDPMLSTTQPPEHEKSAQETELERQIDIARLSNNTQVARQLQAQLDKLRGHVVVQSEFITGSYSETGINIPVEQGDYHQTAIHNLSIMSSAVAVVPAGAPGAGKLWYATTQYIQNSADTLKLFYSTNN